MWQRPPQSLALFVQRGGLQSSGVYNEAPLPRPCSPPISVCSGPWGHSTGCATWVSCRALAELGGKSICSGHALLQLLQLHTGGAPSHLGLGTEGFLESRIPFLWHW
jgi:hypothetical protein